jgi:hypothetical protein
MAEEEIQLVVDRELALLAFQVRRSAQQINGCLIRPFVGSWPRDSYGLVWRRSLRWLASVPNPRVPSR